MLPMFKPSINFVYQSNQMDCGPACLAMITAYHGRPYDMDFLRKHTYISRKGVSLLGIKEAAEYIGLNVFPGKLSVDGLCTKKLPLPAILHWNKNHFVVLVKISRNRFSGKYIFRVADPAHGMISLSQEKFEKYWIASEGNGIALFLTPTEDFYKKDPPPQAGRLGLRHLYSYLLPHKRSVALLMLMLVIGSFFSFAFPFLTQQLIDKGITARDMHFITLILLAQLSLFAGNIVTDMFRNWIVLIVGTKVNIRIISDFLGKLLRLPIKFFDSKLMGDFTQRIADHARIELFLTSQSLPTLFSMITFSVYFGILWYYNTNILLVYLGLSAVSILWSLFWMKKRRILDYLQFQQHSETQESIYEIMKGVSELKLNRFEDYKRREWEKIQERLFAISIRILKLNQVQVTGFELLNQVKNILVTFMAASLVIKGNLTLGALLSVSYIIGQMNAPVSQLMSFFRSMQDARLSLERLNEVQIHPDEEAAPMENNEHTLQQLKEAGQCGELHFRIRNLSFQYEGPRSPFVLKGINMAIRQGKVTAIVGASGSGKTTLMKLLLKFYEPTSGEIMLGGRQLIEVPHSWARQHSGVVMQDGFIFGDTIERNIVCGDEHIDYDRLRKAVRIANIESYVHSLPLGLNTKIGSSGNDISGGQRQRLLIARAVYRNPQFLFFDEATSALDAENEKIIHERLQAFFKGRTVMIIAHRLSTVKNADQIIVLKDGEIVEKGTHQELVSNKFEYYNLVKNQLELGS
ncbi:peptidase domain-containing ABC transporter [Chitinophaga polysaccharea]|uniref:peptidase domain-containing ABC transporter n=1 Tax=Chitinophaga polysaccharea TaxID=1293035 RepID=UPI001C8CF81B|nr:peptidase domain-containing ABC transporter [Chitinophaga polysaccharea]